MPFLSSKTTFPDEHYLKQRVELSKKESAKAGLTNAINRYLDDSVRLYTKSDIAIFGHHDWPTIKELLAQWESRGLLRMVKPIDDASEGDIIIEMLDYIDQKSPFPNWPIKSA